MTLYRIRAFVLWSWKIWYISGP